MTTPNPLRRLCTASQNLADSCVTVAALRAQQAMHPEAFDAERLANARALAFARLASVRGDCDEVERMLEEGAIRQDDGPREMSR